MDKHPTTQHLSLGKDISTDNQTNPTETSIPATITIKVTAIAGIVAIQKAAEILGIESELPLDAVRFVNFQIIISEEAAK